MGLITSSTLSAVFQKLGVRLVKVLDRILQIR